MEGTVIEFIEEKDGILLRKVNFEKELKAALQDVEEGKTRPLRELIEELDLGKDMPT